MLGAVKLTPAHDHTDFRLSQRHSLPRLAVIGGDGAMTSLCGQWLEVLNCASLTQSGIPFIRNVHRSEYNTSTFFFFSPPLVKGVKRFDARERVISALMERKLFRGKRDHPMALPICRWAATSSYRTLERCWRKSHWHKTLNWGHSCQFTLLINDETYPAGY